jgi:predicted transposase YdaD
MERRRFGKVGGDLSRRIDEAVRRARKNEEWRSEYMKELLYDDDVREEGREEGRLEGREEGESQLVKLK